LAAGSLQALADGFAAERAARGSAAGRLALRLQTQAAEPRRRGLLDSPEAAKMAVAAATAANAAEAAAAVEAEAPLPLGVDPPAPTLRILGHSGHSHRGAAVQFEVRFESAGGAPEDFWCDRAELAEGPHAAALNSYEAANGLGADVLAQLMDSTPPGAGR
jgi:hypothetical protein